MMKVSCIHNVYTCTCTCTYWNGYWCISNTVVDTVYRHTHVYVYVCIMLLQLLNYSTRTGGCWWPCCTVKKVKSSLLSSEVLSFGWCIISNKSIVQVWRFMSSSSPPTTSDGIPLMTCPIPNYSTCTMLLARSFIAIQLIKMAKVTSKRDQFTLSLTTSLNLPTYVNCSTPACPTSQFKPPCSMR